jgi:L-ribulose-5-phosphate 3-epimerase
MARIGLMQGRLSEMIDGKIQSFPWNSWQEEFAIAATARFELIEWTLDWMKLDENPLMLSTGQQCIRSLAARYGVQVQSLTGDCFMQAPFWKAEEPNRRALLHEFERILDSCTAVGIRYVVVPLVDNGSLENLEQRESLREGILRLVPWLEAHGVEILFESDLGPLNLADFINSFPDRSFGINYDIGNSASLGFDPATEIRTYGARIRNVHVKDRLRGGTTVPLGEGAGNLPIVFCELARKHYAGDFILQTARAADGDHLGALVRYRAMTRVWIDEAKKETH